jgi:sec-independent protein translocase protein TatA
VVECPDETGSLVIALLFFGGKKLPEIASGLGKGIREFKRAALEPETTDVTPKPITGHPVQDGVAKDGPHP